MQDGGSDGATDSSSDTTPSSLIHQYSLNNSFADDLGGPALTGLGGTLTAGGYLFSNDQGLSVSNAVPTAVYTIDIAFAFADVTGYRKVIDFKALGSDAGLYVYESTLQFVVIPITGCPGNDCYTSGALFADGDSHQVTLARDGAGTVDRVRRSRAAVFVRRQRRGRIVRHHGVCRELLRRRHRDRHRVRRGHGDADPDL